MVVQEVRDASVKAYKAAQAKDLGKMSELSETRVEIPIWARELFAHEQRCHRLNPLFLLRDTYANLADR